MKDYSRFGRETVESIAAGLTACKNASELAKGLGVDVSGLIKHVKKYRVLHETSSRNKCGLKAHCKVVKVCDRCPLNAHRGEPKRCANCSTSNCNAACPLFDPRPDCPRLRKFPYACNGCPKIRNCWLSHYVYDAESAWKAIMSERKDPRKGVHADEAELLRLSKLLVPLVKEKHQSLPQIYSAHRVEVRWSYPTLLKLVGAGLVPGLANIDLTKRVKYPKNYKKRASEPTNAAFLGGRTYDDFVAFYSENPGTEVVEMDTVVSGRGSRACVLTLLFRKSNFMLAFLLPDKTSAAVAAKFAEIRAALGAELYRKTFACVLTDNGSEFADPTAIEFGPETGERTCRLFYCDPGKSGQKGKIERNHVELRKVFPKGTDFAAFTQADLDLAMRHVNSEPRAILNGNAPGAIARAFLDEKVLALNEYSPVAPDEVNLHPSLLSK